MKRASYRHAVEWIAENDEPDDRDPETVAELISTMLIADIFDAEPKFVAADIIRYRERNHA